LLVFAREYGVIDADGRRNRYASNELEFLHPPRVGTFTHRRADNPNQRDDNGDDNQQHL
jgi:hypothetical protein